MEQERDLHLANALWLRAKKFIAAGDCFNALLDLGASHRLFSMCRDHRVEEIYQTWVNTHAQYVRQSSASEKLNSDEKVKKLRSILTHVENRQKDAVGQKA